MERSFALAPGPKARERQIGSQKEFGHKRLLLFILPE